MRKPVAEQRKLPRAPGLWARPALVAIALGFVGGCNEYGHLNEQLPTFANLQGAAAEIQRLVESGAPLGQAEAQAIIGKHLPNGRDAWGSEIVFLKTETSPASFLLISPGKDRKLDVVDPVLYFQAKGSKITGRLDADIVFRDGVALTDGGKP